MIFLVWPRSLRLLDVDLKTTACQMNLCRSCSNAAPCCEDAVRADRVEVGGDQGESPRPDLFKASPIRVWAHLSVNGTRLRHRGELIKRLRVAPGDTTWVNQQNGCTRDGGFNGREDREQDGQLASLAAGGRVRPHRRFVAGHGAGTRIGGATAFRERWPGARRSQPDSAGPQPVRRLRLGAYSASADHGCRKRDSGAVLR